MNDKTIEITEKAVRKDKEVGMADLLNQELAELQKAMIEDMLKQARNETAKEILQSLLDFVNCEKFNQDNAFEKIKETLIKVAKTYEVEVEE